MRIGELAARSGVTVRTIRYYIEEGLLPEPRLRGKYGDFDESYLQRIRLIQRLKEERLAIPAIRQRLMDIGVMPATPPSLQPSLPFPSSPSPLGTALPASLGEEEGTGPEVGGWRRGPVSGTRSEGLFRSRFAEEAGLTPEQVAQLERLGLLESSEGLLPPDTLPLARAIAKLLSWGVSMDDIAAIAQQVRQETTMHRRLLERIPSQDPLPRALQWQEQVGAVTTIREMLLQRWGRSTPEGSH
jgi:DNA-binding transcriptional MerR regulator